MLVKIETTGVMMELDLPKEKIRDLMQIAMESSHESAEDPAEPSYDPEPEEEEAEDAVLSDLQPHGDALEASDDEEQELEPKGREKAKSRVDSMFGSNWRDSIPDREFDEPGRTYHGFLMIECQECGEIHAFCAKQELSEYRCKCGGVTQLQNLIPMFLKCGCGKEFKYQTNMSREEFTHECLACKSPVRMILNRRGTAYVTPGGWQSVNLTEATK